MNEMPPKPKFTREQVVDAAYEIAREKGIEGVVARELAGKLGSTVSPIFTLFENMEEVKNAVYEKAKEECISYLAECFSYTPAFKEFGIRWIRFSMEEPMLYRLMFFHDKFSSRDAESIVDAFGELSQRIIPEISEAFDLVEEDARELLIQMLIYANGFSVFGGSGGQEIDSESIGKNISEMAMGLAMFLNLRRGRLNLKQAGIMIHSTEVMPRQGASKEEYIEEILKGIEKTEDE